MLGAKPPFSMCHYHVMFKHRDKFVPPPPKFNVLSFRQFDSMTPYVHVTCLTHQITDMYHLLQRQN